MTNTTIVPQELAYRQFHDAMSLYVGQGRRWSCAAVADATGIALRTVESYRSGQATPTIEKYQSLCTVLGPAFFAATIAHMPYEVRSTDPGDITPQELLSQTLKFSARLAKFLEDGRIDHRERPEFRERARELVDRLNAALADHDA
ncbi:MAG: helix-turn-helix transcriptional regulator [Roseibium sp.]|nr:helix-turn-helix transcriptional regulator [Roseibium sp.]